MAPWQQRDARLADRAGRGDTAAFEEIYARYHPSILSFCRHLTGHREDAEDAVQHTFLAAYRELLSSKSEIERLRPWLYTVARNRCLSLLKARRAGDAVLPEEGALEGLTAEVERREDLRDLVRDLRRLPEAQRAALILAEIGELTHREIGVVLEVPSEKVKSLVFQARSSLTSTRAAREAPCYEIREQLATAAGSALRRRMLRRHVTQCQGCTDFEVAVREQRRGLESLLPVAPSAGLYEAVFGSASIGEGLSVVKAVSGAGGAGTAITAGGGLGGALGPLATLGAGGVAKLIAVTAVVGGVAGAAASDLPLKLHHAPAAERRALTPEGGRGAPQSGAEETPRLVDAGGAPGGKDKSEAGKEARERQLSAPSETASAEPADPDHHPEGGEGEGPGASGAGGGSDGGGGADGLPPGLAKRDELPPGLAKRDELPPGLAKRDGSIPPGQVKKEGQPGSGPGNAGGGNGNGSANPGSGGAQGNGNSGSSGKGNGGKGG